MTDPCNCPMSVRERMGAMSATQRGEHHSVVCPMYMKGPGAAILDTPEQIDTFALALTARAARMKANGGLQLTSRLPSLKQVCRRWGIEAGTWSQAADKLQALLAAQERELGKG